jgi:serine/threonine protein kinase
MDVAVKELKIETPEAQTKIKAEADLMQKLDHPHVIKFLGICMDTQMMSFKIVLEYAPLGDLKTYLENNSTPNQLPINKIVKVCYQMALAMEYLASKSVVHRDLAARNVLLISDDCCKVTDFGLSRSTNDNNYYAHHVTNDSLLPLKWYPLELIKATINDLKFNEKTDVWSFGVTCWEATSYGKVPYENMSMALVENALENGRKPLGKFYF